MKVEQLNNVQIDWTKPQVVVSEHSEQKFMIITNHKPFDEDCFSAYEILTGYIHDNLYKNAFKPENATEYPIELKLTIESDEELCNLRLRCLCASSVINNNTDIDMKSKADLSDMNLSYLLDKLAKERNLYKND